MRIAMAIERIHLNNMPYDKNGYHATGDLVKLVEVEYNPQTKEAIVLGIEDRYWEEYENEIWEDLPDCKEVWEDEEE